MVLKPESSGGGESTATRLAAERAARERAEREAAEAARRAAEARAQAQKEAAERASRESAYRAGRRPRVDLGAPGESRTGETAQASAGVPTGQAAQYDYFRHLIESSGGKFRVGANQRNLIGFRQEDKTTANGGAGRYNDVLAMVWRDDSGKPHVRLYRYNTEPAQDLARAASDVNDDGVSDMGRIPNGHYEYALSTWRGGRPCLRSTSDFRAERDMDHDGDFDENKLTGGGAAMLFHLGGGGGTYSAGCQTFPTDEWERFWADVKGARGTIGYTLVEGTPDGITDFVSPAGRDGASHGDGALASGGGGSGGGTGGDAGARSGAESVQGAGRAGASGSDVSASPLHAERLGGASSAGRLPSDGQGTELFTQVLQSLMQLSAQQKEQLERDPELRKFVQHQRGMQGWQPGMPIPEMVMASFFTEKLGAVTSAAGPASALAGLLPPAEGAAGAAGVPPELPTPTPPSTGAPATVS